MCGRFGFGGGLGVLGFVGCEAEDDIEAGIEFTDTGLWEGGEVDFD
ncbi:MAG: hypothetical protein RI897_3890 [Verrucomicrobiota bacterium]